MKKFIIAGLLIFLAPLVLATVSSTTTQQSFTGAGSSSLSVTLPFHANSHLGVWIQDTSTTPTSYTQLTYGAGAGKFTITGGDPGTTVVLGTALTATQTAIVKRVVPLTQTTDYVDNGPFRAETHEKALDRLTMQVQQVDSDTSKKIGLSPVSTATTPTFPDPVANTFIQYDVGGSVLQLSPASPTTGDVLKFGTGWEKYNLDTAMALKADASALTSHATDMANPHNVTAGQISAATLGDLTTHTSDTANPHSVTAAQVGNGTAQWNADKIQGKTVDASAISDGRVLQFSAGSDTIVWGAAPLAPSLTDSHIFVGNAANNAADVAASGDVTLANTGAFTVGTVGGATAANIATTVTTVGAASAPNSAGKLVVRDALGDFGASTITANLIGNVTGNASTATTAGNVSGTVAIANGGTGQITANAALNALMPSQTGNSGKFLYTTGTDTGWSTVSAGDALPTQTGNNGKYLTTDGAAASWAAVSASLPSQTGNGGKVLGTDGTNVGWSTVQVSTSASGGVRVEYAVVGSACTSGTCTLTASSPGISSIVYNATGDYAVNFVAGTFSSSPACSFNAGNTANAQHTHSSGATTSGVAHAYFENYTSHADLNSAFDVFCIGAR